MAISYGEAGKPERKQAYEAFWERKAVEAILPEQYFQQLASFKMMPKNTGKVIKRYVEIPILDDKNENDEGIDAAGRKSGNGNLYGSSRDIGTIVGALPVIGEHGGRANRVGISREEIEGTLANYGYFLEYTRDSIDFDSDPDLEQYYRSEVISTANKIQEDLIQMDLLLAAGVIVYAGKAVSEETIDASCVVSFEDFARLAVILDNNKCPRNTKMLTGSTNTDTVTLPSARASYCSPDLTQVYRKMKDYHGDKAWIPSHQYASQGATLRGEQGSIDQFRMIITDTMMKSAGVGAKVNANDAIMETGGKADVYNILTVGDDCFTAIGFQSTGSNSKFEINHKKPTDQVTRDDPYGKIGLISIQWWYGILIYRPERIAVIKTACPK